MQKIAAIVLSLILVGCATTVPYTGVGPHPQLERGKPIPPIDALGNFLALPMKLLLLSWKFDSHSISPQTEEKLVEYLNAQQLPFLKEAKFQLNEYHPSQDLARLVHNHEVAWPYRLLLGFPLTLAFEVLLPGRLFPWGDYYNPYTNTVHLFSNHPAIALHEAGHVHDFASRHYKGTYAFCRLIPGVDLYQEYKATTEALTYLKENKDHPTELSAYKILYPAYGSYVGSYVFPPIGTAAGIIIGHVAGRSQAALAARSYQEEGLTPAAAPAQTPTTPSPAPPRESPSPRPY